jgi:hypothetical protein
MGLLLFFLMCDTRFYGILKIGSSCSFIVTTGELTIGVVTTVSCTVGAATIGSVKNGS